MIVRRLATRLNQAGVLHVHAGDERSQHRNRDVARDRLADIVRNALKTRKRRRPTKPSAGAKRRRLDAKKHRGKVKQLRQAPPRFDD